jgi:hypothetical protein
MHWLVDGKMGKWMKMGQIPSGKRLHNDGKSQFLLGKSTIFFGNFKWRC